MEFYQRRCRKGKTEARGDVAAAKLITSIRDSQEVEFLVSFFGLPVPGLP
jgi:isocitrate lyase